MENQLESIFVEEYEFKVTEKASIKIKTIAVGDIPVVLNFMNKYLDAMPKLKSSTDKNQFIIKAIADDFDFIVKLLNITTSLTIEEVKKLNMAALVLISTEVINKNADFLYQNVMPAFQNLSHLFKESQKEVVAGTSKSKS